MSKEPGEATTARGLAPPSQNLRFLTLSLLILAVSFAVIVPMFFFGNASGHDFEFHMNSWMEVVQQWKQGIIYPRWAALAHYGYGEARFLFYPPASWVIGALLGTFLPWSWVSGAYVWLALLMAGLSMYLLARTWLSSADALFAAALYAANPYHLVIVYWRSAFAELLASAILPLLLFFIVREQHRQWKIIVPLSIVVAAAWLTNAPAAVMANYSLALLAVTFAIVRRTPRILLYAAAAVVLGAGLAGYYLVPAAYEERWVNIAQVLAPGVRPQDNFLFTNTDNADHNRFNLLVSTVATSELCLLAAGIWMSRKQRYTNPAIWWSVVVWGSAAALLPFSFTSLFWSYFPKLRFVQLPWRWLLCLNVGFALVVTMAFRRCWTRTLVYAAMLAVIAVSWQRIQSPWWDTVADVEELQDELQSGAGYEGTDEYVPLGADPYEIKQDAGRAVVTTRGQSQVHMGEWTAEKRALTVEVSEPATLTLRLFNYPAWAVEVNGQKITPRTKKVTGQTLIPLQAGRSVVQIRFQQTRDRLLGKLLSFMALIALVTLVICARKSLSRIQVAK